MLSLTAHLLEPGDHGRLGFHPRCPVCRQDRLFGALSSEPVISRRAQAALASGVIALSAAAPASSLAAQPDPQNEGSQPPETPGPEENDRPGFDPGGDTTLPFETPPPPSPPADGGAPDSQDSTPLETEPTDDPDVPPVVPAVPLPGPDPRSDPSGGDTDGPAAPSVPAPDGSTPSDDAPPADEAPAAGDAPPVAHAPRERVPPEGEQQRRVRDHRAHNPRHEAPAPTLTVAAPPAAGPTPAITPAVAPVAEVATAETASVGRKPERAGNLNGRFFVVRPGDSLWSIAKHLLGRTATPAQIAREVTRLWRLNEGRIGTGDPDLLAVGTKLRLR